MLWISIMVPVNIERVNREHFSVFLSVKGFAWLTASHLSNVSSVLELPNYLLRRSSRHTRTPFKFILIKINIAFLLSVIPTSTQAGASLNWWPNLLLWITWYKIILKTSRGISVVKLLDVIIGTIFLHSYVVCQIRIYLKDLFFRIIWLSPNNSIYC